MKSTRIKCKTIEEAKAVLQMIEDRHPEVSWGGGEKPTEFHPWEIYPNKSGYWFNIEYNSIYYGFQDTEFPEDWVNATSAKRFLRKAATSIHIYQRGKMVIAHESETGREGIAKCSPDDKFDFSIGARIALLRLFGEEVPDSLTGKEKIEEKEEFKVGDRVIIRDWDDMEKEFGVNAFGSIKCNHFFTVRMKKYCGKVARIINADRDDFALEFEDGKEAPAYVFSHEMFRKVGEDFKAPLKPYDEIKIGDEVEIVNPGKCYTTYPKWVAQNIEDKETIAKYAYEFTPSVGTRGKVLKIAEHGMWDDGLLVYINDVTSNKCYLIGIKGVKKIES